MEFPNSDDPIFDSESDDCSPRGEVPMEKILFKAVGERGGLAGSSERSRNNFESLEVRLIMWRLILLYIMRI